MDVYGIGNLFLVSDSVLKQKQKKKKCFSSSLENFN